MINDRHAFGFLAMVGLLLCGVLFWNAFCYFPFDSWNAIRLAPAAMLRAGVSPYPGLLDGPVTTWTYGPVPLLWMLPAVISRDPVTILLLAAGLNLLLVAIPVSLWCFIAGSGLETTKTRLTAAALIVLLWPGHNFYFFQADNAALAFGLASNLVLTRVSIRQPFVAWLAAVLAALALWSKQNEIGLMLGQVAWCAWRFGARTGLAYAVRIVAAAAGLGALFALWLGAEGLYFNLFGLFAGVPIGSPVKLFDSAFIRFTSLYLIGPVILIVGLARQTFRRDSPWLLPGLVFVFSLPINLAAFCAPGGTVNSLHAYVYLLPTVVFGLLSAANSRTGAWPAWAGLGGAVAIWLLVGLPHPWKPLTRGIRQGVSLARQLPDEVYFPWNPLITWCTEGRFDHVEDGLRVRLDAGVRMPREIVRRYFPPKMSVIAYHAAVTEGYVIRLAPAEAKRTRFGEWILLSWDAGKQ